MDLDASKLMSVAEAIGLIDQLPVRPRRMLVALDEAAGWRLAEDIRADRDYPPLDRSLVDGYAVRSADVGRPPALLKVVGEIAAGQLPDRNICPGEAMTVMTGAAIPPGADAVVPIEQTGSPDFAEAGQSVSILRPTPTGNFIVRRGGDVRQGAVVLPAGTVLGAAQIAVAACTGAVMPPVWDKPVCAVLATGNEIIPPGQVPTAAQLRNSNSPMLVALLRRLGYRVRDLGVAVDKPEVIAAAIRDGLGGDALFITGGVSMGKYDHVPKILAEIGGELKITKLRIKPGKPFVLAAMPEGKFVFGLPGNPVSAMVCTLRLASRLLSRMAGGRAEDHIRHATLSADVAANGSREFYQPAVFDGHSIRPLEWKGSADIFTLAAANALIIRPENAPELPAGATAPIIELP
jgi:molybdopterin molybdotransferase